MLRNMKRVKSAGSFCDDSSPSPLEVDLSSPPAKLAAVAYTVSESDPPLHSPVEGIICMVRLGGFIYSLFIEKEVEIACKRINVKVYYFGNWKSLNLTQIRKVSRLKGWDKIGFNGTRYL